MNKNQHHFINKIVGPSLDLVISYLSKSFFPRDMDRLMLQHSMNDTPLGTSFLKQSTLEGSFYIQVGFITS